MHSTLQIYYYTSMQNVDQVGFYRNMTYIEIVIYVRHSETLSIQFTYIRKILSAWFSQQ
jgi:hypothetical protein